MKKKLKEKLPGRESWGREGHNIFLQASEIKPVCQKRKQACSTVGINTRAFFFLICVKVRLRRNWIPHEFAYVPSIEQLNNILEICSVVWHCGALEGLDIF